MQSSAYFANAEANYHVNQTFWFLKFATNLWDMTIGMAYSRKSLFTSYWLYNEYKTQETKLPITWLKHPVVSPLTSFHATYKYSPTSAKTLASKPTASVVNTPLREPSASWADGCLSLHCPVFWRMEVHSVSSLLVSWSFRSALLITSI